MLPPAGHEASSLPSSLQETLDRLEEEGQKKADDLSRELTIREVCMLCERLYMYVCLCMCMCMRPHYHNFFHWH